jgi:drug/metabolite transporter (DMT)-like permease
MPLGVLFALSAYALYSCCDAIIKGFGSNLSVHEIAFFSALFSLVPAIFAKAPGEHWRHVLRLKYPRLVHLRGLSGLLGNLCIIYAFVTIPLAEAYSLAFLAPIFIVGLSVLALGERVSWQRVLFLSASFCGVLLVVRPGFRELQPGHLAAVAAAFCGAITTTVLRKVAPHESRVSLIGIALGYIIVVNGIWMIPDFRLMTWPELGLMIVIGGLGGTGNMIFIAATRRAPASEIAPVQYSQIAWAIILGAIFYREYPDALAVAGLAVVVGAGILNVISDETRIRIFSRLSLTGFGPATAVAKPQVAPGFEDGDVPLSEGLTLSAAANDPGTAVEPPVEPAGGKTAA